MDEFVKVEKLTKKYGDFTAVDNLSFTVSEHEIFGFLGPNGAGKTTTLNVISTLSNFDRGDVNIAGYDIKRDEFKIKSMLGLVPQEIALYPTLTAAENVSLFASLYGLKGKALKSAVDDALEFVELAGEKNKRPQKMSGGMQRRLNIACGIAHKPRLIIMDEPTVGVDARSRDNILRSIRTLRDEGATIIYTSHYMPEVQELADRIAIIDKGVLAAIGTENELLEFVTDRKSIRISVAGGGEAAAEAAAADIGALAGVKRARFIPDASEISLDVDLTLENISPIFNIFTNRSVTVRSFEEEAPNLEATFLALTGRDLNDDTDDIGNHTGKKGGRA